LLQSKMTIGRKFALTGAFLMVMTMALGLVSLLGLSSADRSIAAVADDSLAGVSACSLVESGLLEIRGDIWRHISSRDSADMANVEQQIQKLKEQVKTGIATMQKGIFTDEERELNRKIQPLVDQYYRAWDGIIDLSRASKNEEAYKKYMAEAAPAYEAARAAVAAETEYNRSTGSRNSAEAHSQSSHTQALVWVVLIVAVLAGCGLLFAMVRSINTALIQAVSEVGSGAVQVASAASQIAASSQALAQGSSEQAASLEETSSSSEEINSMARKNAANSETMSTLVDQSQEMFTRANRELDEMVVSMDEINQSSSKISKIIKVIDDIAFQTNILALNAAVEEARAGEAGMGFAVVAEEVRNLAQRSAQAAKDTSSLIEESIAKSNGGKQKVDRVADAIRTITEDSGKIKILVDEVTLGSSEQTRGLDQISKAINQMEQVTQSTAAAAEQGAAAAEELDTQSTALKQAVAQLNAMIVGGGTASGRESRGQGLNLLHRLRPALPR